MKALRPLLAIPLAVSLVSCAGKPPKVDGTIADAAKWCRKTIDKEIALIKETRKLTYEEAKDIDNSSEERILRSWLVDKPGRQVILIRDFCRSEDWKGYESEYAFYRPWLEYVVVPEYGDLEIKKELLSYKSFTYKKEA